MKNSAEKRKNPRITARFAIKFFVNHRHFMGMSCDLSESGVFVTTNRNFQVNSPIELELLLPGRKTAFLKGIITRTSKAGRSSVKDGIGIQIVQNDQHFLDFLKTSTQKQKSLNRVYQTCAMNAEPVHTGSHGGALPGQNTLSEKRRYTRVSVSRVDISLEIAAATQAAIINVSKCGMLVKSDRRLMVGCTYPVKIQYKGKTVRIRARAMWALLVEGIVDAAGNHIPFYVTGMQFPDDTEDIVSFLAHVETAASLPMLQIRRLQKMLPQNASGMRPEQIVTGSFREGSHGQIPEISEKGTSEEMNKTKRSARRYFERGKLEFWNGNFAKAAGFFDHALSHDSSSGKYHAFYAQTLAKLGNFSEAEQAIQKALSIDPYNTDYLVEAGNIYYAMGSHGRAKITFEMALNLQPSHIKAHKALFSLKGCTDKNVLFHHNPLRTFKKIIES